MMYKEIIPTVAMAALLLAGPASAGEKMGYGSSMSKEKKEMHYKNVEELASMMKEMMIILRDLNHFPTAAQKKRLDEMIRKTDEISKERGRY